MIFYTEFKNRMKLSEFLYEIFYKENCIRYQISLILPSCIKFNYLQQYQIHTIEKILKNVYLYDYFEIYQSNDHKKIVVELRNEYNNEEKVENIILILKLKGLFL